MMTVFLAAAALHGSPAAQAAIDDLGPARTERLAACGVDAERLAALLALDQQAFDQDFTGGWRTVAARDGCDTATADLIEVWRDHSPNKTSDSILHWHAGQMRAHAGETDAAIALFNASRSESRAWNLYVDASIAFLRGDRPALEAARAELATLTPSEELQAARRSIMADNPEIVFPDGFVEQPQNLNVVDRFLACFGGSYAGAYSGECDAPPVSAIAPDEACAFARQRIDAASVAPPVEVALAVSPDWAASPAPRGRLADLLSQRGRGREGAAFGFAFDEAFADAAAPLTDADLDRIAAAWARAAPIACPGLDTGSPPFTADMGAFLAWAEANMAAPEPGAPDGATTLALSRPVLFDDDRRLIVIEQSSYTPMPISRPPSALAAVVIYRRGEAGWDREASLVIARGG